VHEGFKVCREVGILDGKQVPTLTRIVFLKITKIVLARNEEKECSRVFRRIACLLTVDQR
jgi:hypothetical protein